MSPLNAAICTTTYLKRQKCYGPDKKILFKKQLFDLEVKVPRRSLWYATHRLWSCTHIPNVIDLSRKTKKLSSGQASLRRSGRSGRKNQTKTICLPSLYMQTFLHFLRLSVKKVNSQWKLFQNLAKSHKI
jgi:hypothetical protein